MAINAGMSPDIVVDKIMNLEDKSCGMNFYEWRDC